MSSADKQNEGSGFKFPGNGRCVRAGIPESDTGESGEESEPTYRHYDKFETYVCLTQDEDDEHDDNPGVVHNVGQNLQAIGKVPLPLSVISKLVQNGANKKRESPPASVSRDLGLGVGAAGLRGVSSDSDSCTESEMTREKGQVTDDTTTTSTSESEETQM